MTAVAGWKRKRLDQFILLQRGFDLPARDRIPGKYKVLSSGQAAGNHNEARVKGPGFVVGRATNIGRPIWSNDDYWPLNTVLYAKDFLGNEPRFAYYWFVATDLTGFNSGSVQPMLNRNYIAHIELDVPPPDEQREIAGILGSLDDKIAANHRAIALMEELGATLLKGRVRTEPSGALVTSTQGLEEFIDVLETGSRPRGGLKTGTVGTISLGAQHVQSAGVCRQTDFKHVPDNFAASMRRGRLSQGDVLVYKDGGKPGNFIPHISAFGRGFPVENAVINEHVYRVRASGGISQALLYWVLRSTWLDAEMRKRGTGVAIPGLNSSNFRELPFPELKPDDIDFLNDSLGPLLDQMLRLGGENVRIAALRNVLLPELLAGRIRTQQAANSVEGAVA